MTDQVSVDSGTAAQLQELNDIVFSPVRRGPRQGAGNGLAELEMVVVRALTELDVTDIEGNRPLVAQRITTPLEMKHSHHQLARLIALGKDVIEISLLTGYTPSYISSLKGGKDFQELIEFYSGNQKTIFLDTLERMKLAGVTSLERLQALLDNEEEKWTKRELMEMAELMLIKPAQVQKQGGGASSTSPVTVNVKFVSAQADQGELPPPMLDITPTEE